MLYFAYGSNLDWKRMKNRCPSASFYCMTSLPNYRIDFTRKSSENECGVADIVKDNNFKIYGVVYRIDEIDLGKLDKREGYIPQRGKNAYKRIEIIVFEEDNKEKPITAFTYEVVEKEFGKYKPNKDYKGLIVTGAKYWKLPKEYIKFLENIETMEDK
jgi:gamma-glutamylcyclotransferase (GGCT)/AIG2-like uncharacterized protein YtfP